MTESLHPYNQPDVVLYNFGRFAIQCFEVSCPADVNMITKETEKVNKYQPLVSYLRQLHPQMIVEVVPIVIGHTGVVSLHSKLLFSKIPGFCVSFFTICRKQYLLELFTSCEHFIFKIVYLMLYMMHSYISVPLYM